MPEITDTPEAVAPPSDAPPVPESPAYEPPTDDEPSGDLDDLEELDFDDEPPGPREETEEEILVPKVDPVQRVLRDERGQERAYTQAAFLGFQQTEMYSLLSRCMRIVMEGESGMRMEDMLRLTDPKSIVDDMMSRLPGYEDAPDRAETQVGYDDAMRMMSALTRLLEASHGTLLEAYCIILNVPPAHRNWAMEWAMPRTMTREEQLDIMETFIDQNWGVVYGFFTEELPRLMRRAAAAHRRFRELSGRRRGR